MAMEVLFQLLCAQRAALSYLSRCCVLNGTVTQLNNKNIANYSVKGILCGMVSVREIAEVFVGDFAT